MKSEVTTTHSDHRERVVSAVGWPCLSPSSRTRSPSTADKSFRLSLSTGSSDWSHASILLAALLPSLSLSLSFCRAPLTSDQHVQPTDLSARWHEHRSIPAPELSAHTTHI